MKQKLKNAAFAIGIIALGITGCKKEGMNVSPAETNVTESEIQFLVAQTGSGYDALASSYDESTGTMTIANEGLAADYLMTVDDLDAGQNSVRSSGTTGNAVRDNSFIRCLVHLKLEEDQAAKIRVVLGDYKDCNVSAIHRARAIHHQLQEKFKGLAQDQVKLLRAGKITKAEYDERITRLRHAFHKELRQLQLKEKLGEALENCHKTFLRHLNGILSERQWKAFVSCYRK